MQESGRQRCLLTEIRRTACTMLGLKGSKEYIFQGSDHILPVHCKRFIFLVSAGITHLHWHNAIHLKMVQTEFLGGPVAIWQKPWDSKYIQEGIALRWDGQRLKDMYGAFFFLHRGWRLTVIHCQGWQCRQMQSWHLWDIWIGTWTIREWSDIDYAQADKSWPWNYG